MIDIKIDTRDVERYLDSVQREQIPFAASRALNTVAFQVMREGRDHIKSGLDKPTRWPIQSWYVRRKADKQSLIAVVGWSDYLNQKRLNPGGSSSDAEYYLSQQWNGGGRKHKAFERQLIKAGFMPSGMYAVPGAAAEELGMMDGFGNMKPSVIVAILSSIGSFNEAGFKANATARQSKRMSAAKSAKRHVYWAGKPGKNTPNGIWIVDEKHSDRGRLRPVIVFVNATNYKPRLDLESLARNVRERDMPREFNRALEYALRTAR